MARDGAHSRLARSVGAMGPLVTLLVASFALVALTKRRHTPLAIASHEPAPEPTPSMVALSTPAPIEARGEAEIPLLPKIGLPRFFTGTLAGVTTGIVLGITAALLITIANPDVRSAVIVGVTLRAPALTTDGEYIARIVAQDMNPNLAYADPEGVAALLAQTPEPEETKQVLPPVQQDLQDNAGFVFLVLGTLTLASWALIMRGLSGTSQGMGEAVVE